MASDKKLRHSCLMAFFLIVVLSLVASCTPTEDQVELIQTVYILEDKSASASLEDVSVGNFIQSDRSINLGYSDSAYWIRMRILPAVDGSNVILVVNPKVLDEVLLYEPAPLSLTGPDTQENGNAYAIRGSGIGLISRTYVLSPPTSGADYFLRVASAGSISVNVSAQSASDALRSMTLENFSKFIYLIFLILLIYWSLQVYASLRAPIILYFLPLLLLWVFHNLFSLGFMAIIFPNHDVENDHTAFRYAVLLLSVTTFLFHRAILIPFQPPKAARMLMDACIFLTTTLLLFYIIFKKDIALEVNSYAVAASPLIFLFVAATATRDAFVGLNAVKLFYGALSFLNAFWAAELLGFNFGPVAPKIGPLAYGLMTAPLIFLILFKYSLELSRAAKARSAQFEEVYRKGLIEKEARKSLTEFIDMLTHETKNALAVISMNLSNADLDAVRAKRVFRAMSGLNNVIDRCDQSVRLGDIHDQLRIENCKISDILKDVCENCGEGSRTILSINSEPAILGDPVFLNIILSNLLENALKYSPTFSKVNVALDAKHGEAILVFENEKGYAGMPDREMVFQRHYRNAGAQSVSGSGLGLFICANLAKAQNGNIVYMPEENRIRFILSFPCAT